MNVIETIKKPILVELQTFEKALVDELKTDNPLLTSIGEFIQQGRGKQLRPILVFLSAKLCGTINYQTVMSAVSIELLHTASLIHDDVVDSAYKRRGRPSVNARWNNKIAILAGDYLLSKSLNCAVKANNLEILNVIAKIGMELTD
ncbi:MAG TPA: polyprenyl synthetase family protein, partial [Paludibacteraceae bacterium]|nr:polyprenyl synthetase family protein [Paludibacteraceae bacterium]